MTASNVTIDLQGFTIMSTVSTTGNGINATGQSNVVIRNGIIMGFGGAAIVTGNNGEHLGNHRDRKWERHYLRHRMSRKRQYPAG